MTILKKVLYINFIIKTFSIISFKSRVIIKRVRRQHLNEEFVLNPFPLSILQSVITKHMIIPSIVNCAVFYALPKFQKLILVFLLFLTSALLLINLLVSFRNPLFTWLTIIVTLWKTLMSLWTNLNISLHQSI